MSSSTGASERRPGIGALAALALALACLATVGAVPAAAQEAPAQAATTVGLITVWVDGQPGDPGLLDLIPFRSGDAFSPRLVDQAVKQIFKTGLFADVRVTKTGEQPVDLTFDLTRKVFLNAVRFRGPRASATRLIQGMTALRPGGYLQEDRVPQAVKEVEAGLRREGYFDAVVVCDVRTKAPAMANLLFRALDWKTFRIGGLEVEWKSEIPERTLLKKMKTKVGQIYVPSRLESDLQALSRGLDLAGYPRAEVRLAGESFDEENRRVDLRLEILPNEKIVILVSGAKVPLRLLAPIWEERVFDQWGLAEGEARILSTLRRRGYLFATVRSRIEKGPGEMRILHEVAPGDKFKISRVDFRGNQAFTSVDLRTRLALREGVPILSLLGYDKIFAIPVELSNLYKQNGFADVQVKLDLVQEPPRGVRAVIEIAEGPRTSVEAIRIDGAALVPADAVRRELISRESGPYFPPNVQRDVGQIETFYLNRGIRGTDVTARVERLSGPSVNLIYEITEGTQVTVQDVFLTGYRATRNRVIRRELRIGKGDNADYAKIQESKRRLERLGIFSEINMDEVQTSPSQEVVVVTVREGEQNYAGVGLGFESRNPVVGPVADWLDFRPRGTAEYIRSNVFGLGAQVGVLGQYSTIERRAVLSWNQPYLLGLALPTTLLGWAEREARTGFTFDRIGLSLSAAKPLSKARLLLGSLSVTRTKIVQPVDLSQLPPNIDRQFLPYSAALASVSLSWERRDDTLNPTRGWFGSVVGEIGVPLFGTEANYQKVFFKGQYFRPLLATLNFGLTGRIGLGNGLSHLPERFFAGGSNTFRGEEFEMLGPIAPAPADPTTFKPYGGEAVTLINSEFTWALFPAWKELRLATFFDLGNVYESLAKFRPFKLEGAAGAGLRYRTPLGPVRVEIAWKLWGFDVQDHKGHPLIFLTIGNIF